MVGLDFSKIDRSVIHYTGVLSKLIKPNKIYFINVQKSLETSETLWKDFPDYRVPKDERLSHNMTIEVERNFHDHEKFDIEYIVAEGSPLKELQHWIEIKNIDLLVVGQKELIKGSGILPQQLARAISAAVLFVPQKAHKQIDDVLVPIDFSEPSKKALITALSMAHDNPNASIFCQHVFYVPKGYYYTEKGKNDMRFALTNLYKQEYNQFIAPLNMNGTHLSPLLSCGENDEPALITLNTARNKSSDIIIIGGAGKTWFDKLLLGSFTEKLLQINKEIPMLIIKNK